MCVCVCVCVRVCVRVRTLVPASVRPCTLSATESCREETASLVWCMCVFACVRKIEILDECVCERDNNVHTCSICMYIHVLRLR